MTWRSLVVAVALACALAAPASADYSGPMIDAHSHLPKAAAIDTYVDAMKRHNIAKVVLLGVGGVQKDDLAWIQAAARKHPTRVITGLPLANPTDDGAAEAVDAALGKSGARAIGEVHIRQVSRKIERDPGDGPFSRVLEVAGRRGVPVVIHDELNERATLALTAALKANPRTTIVLAHAGSATPKTL